MYLKTLTVRGFKSFASATTFEFEPGVTAVVGPNGSGKSNVVDALAWVMGEQGAKTLRGGKMEDVIFAGTSARPALGRAQVSLTIDNTDGALPIEYSEVTISRTLFRSGGSEYAINGSPVRLLDIQELLSDSGLGREMHVIVGQGQLDRILHATPEDRRGFIEEAAGILKHRRRKEKTLRKLDATQANLNRLEDLTQEISRQLKPLGRQAATARRARTVQATLRDARARLLADDLVALQDEARAARQVQEELKGKRASAQQRHDAAAAEVARLEAASARSAPLTAAARRTWYDLSRLDERYRSLASLAAERQRLLGSAEETQHRGEDPESIVRRADATAAQAEEAENAVEQAKTELGAAGEARSRAEEAQRAEDERLTSLLRAVADRREGLARLAGQVGTARQRVESAEGERSRAAEARDAAQLRRDEARALVDEAEREAEDAAAAAGAPGTTVAELTERHRAAKASLDAARTRLNTAVETRAGYAARVAALAESTPSVQGSEELLDDDAAQLAGVLGERLRVKEGFEAAVQAGLLSAARAAVARDGAVTLRIGRRAADLVAAGENPPPVRLLESPGQTRDEGVAAPGTRQLIEVVEADEADAPLLAALLHGVLLAQDDAEARRIARETGSVVVTPSGNRWTTAGVEIGSAAEAGLLMRRAALETAQEDLAAARREEEAARGAMEQAEPALQRTADELDEARRVAREAAETSRLASARHEQLRTVVQHASSDVERQHAAEEAASATAAQAQEQLAELTDRLEAAQAVPEESEPSTADRDRLAQEATGARAAEVEARLALRAAEEKARQLRDRERSQRRAAESERQARIAAEARARRRAAQARRAQDVAQQVEKVREALARSVSRAEHAVQTCEADEARRATEVEVARGEQRQAAADLEAITERAHQSDLSASERASQQQALAERALNEVGMTEDHLVENYGPHLPVPVEDAGTDKWAALRQEVDDEGNPVDGIPFVREEQVSRLKRAERDLAALGKVNPLALEEFAALEERHSYLTEQLADLKKSRADLLNLVREVDEHVRTVFAEAFEDTAREFVRVFGRLFPGGEGRLKLTDPEDMLTTGIEVEARPAGKKVKRLSLLSGGERSLTAIAMLVAIFTARPSPFYVMDEVEAALDERNLLRLLDVFRDLRERSQLIIITHQKHTMDIADALYGVSMRGDGVTKVISQRIEREDA